MVCFSTKSGECRNIAKFTDVRIFTLVGNTLIVFNLPAQEEAEVRDLSNAKDLTLIKRQCGGNKGCRGGSGKRIREPQERDLHSLNLTWIKRQYRRYGGRKGGFSKRIREAHDRDLGSHNALSRKERNAGGSGKGFGVGGSGGGGRGRSIRKTHERDLKLLNALTRIKRQVTGVLGYGGGHFGMGVCELLLCGIGGEQRQDLGNLGGLTRTKRQLTGGSGDGGDDDGMGLPRWGGAGPGDSIVDESSDEQQVQHLTNGDLTQLEQNFGSYVASYSGGIYVRGFCHGGIFDSLFSIGSGAGTDIGILGESIGEEQRQGISSLDDSTEIKQVEGRNDGNFCGIFDGLISRRSRQANKENNGQMDDLTRIRRQKS